MGGSSDTSAATIAALTGAIALASAMGIGRFFLTPILPLMQHERIITLAEGGWLATANYLGYLCGAVVCIALTFEPARAIRSGLAAIAAFTAAMGASPSLSLSILLRFAAGVSSALVLVGVSVWAMPILVRSGKEQWSSYVFAGVGLGIGTAGFLGLFASFEGWHSNTAWFVAGAMAAVVAVCLWRPLRTKGHAASGPPPAVQGMPKRVSAIALCYGLFGYGYILPATFLPVLARERLDDPAMFGSVWPAFGLAAACSVLASELIGRTVPPRRLWAGAQWILTMGVLAPAVSLSAPTLLLSALCVGGTFMVITMAGIKEALTLAVAAPARVTGLMTASFALGQIAGPITVNLLPASGDALRISLTIAALALLLSNLVLLIEGRLFQDAIRGSPSPAQLSAPPFHDARRERPMIDAEELQSLLRAVRRYFDLMYDGDVSHFDQVFASSAQLHGLRNGGIQVLEAHDYRTALASRPSPKSKNAPREQEVLLLDFASETQALVKVRVRINTLRYCDYLSYHRVGSEWLITAKSFHIEQHFEP